MNQFVLLLLFAFAAFSFSARAFSAFISGAVDQDLFKKALSNASAADILVILQSKVDYASLRGVQGWN